MALPPLRFICHAQGRYPLAAHVPFTCRLHYLLCTAIVKIAYRCSASCWMYVSARVRIPLSPPVSYPHKH